MKDSFLLFLPCACCFRFDLCSLHSFPSLFRTWTMETYDNISSKRQEAFTLIVPERIYRKTGYMKNTVNLDKNVYKYTCTALTFYSSAWLNITLQQWMPFYFKNDQNVYSWILIYLFQLSKRLLWQEIHWLGTTCGSSNFSEYMETSIW